jgi:hypothetical protein
MNNRITRVGAASLAAPPEYVASSGSWNRNLIHTARQGLTDLAKKLVVDKI